VPLVFNNYSRYETKYWPVCGQTIASGWLWEYGISAITSGPPDYKNEAADEHRPTCPFWNRAYRKVDELTI